MSVQYETHHIEWQGIAIEIRWAQRWHSSDAYAISHLELRSHDNVQLPMTETGYRSHFIDKDSVEDAGGPVTYSLAWLAHEAASPAWKRYLEDSKQLSLF